MSTLVTNPPELVTFADLLNRLGGIPPDRVRLKPTPGSATEQDVIDVEAKENRLCELVDGVLVEKATGLLESLLAAALISRLRDFVRPRKLGIVTGEGGMMRLFAGLVRIPDVAFASWDRLPGSRVPNEPIPQMTPDLAVEILSQSNTAGEMARKREEYFNSGVRLVWLINPQNRTVAIYAGDGEPIILTEGDTLDGGAVLPGFEMSIAEYFAELDEIGNRPPD